MYSSGSVSNSHLPFVAPGQARGAAHASTAGPILEAELEAAHAELRRAALSLEHELEPVIDLAPTARSLERALGAVFDAFDGRSDKVEAVRTATVELDRTGPAISAGAALDPAFTALGEHIARARGHLVAAEARLAYLVPTPLAEPPDLVASTTTPRLHVLRRDSLAPTLRVPLSPPPDPPAEPLGAIPRPKTFAELSEAIAELKKRGAALSQKPKPDAAGTPDAAPPTASVPRVVPPGFDANIGTAVDEATFLRIRTRECFEDVAMVGMQRAPLLGDPWRTAIVLERRMLAAIDLIAAMGPRAVEHVPRLVADAPVKDPSRAFGIAMVLGCFAGRDALAAAEYALLTCEPDASLVEEFGAALKLVPHDQVALATRTLLRDPDPTVRAMAIDVLGYRGIATPEELVLGASDRPAVAARALQHLALTPSVELPALIQAAAASDDPILVASGWTAMALTNQPHTSAALTTGLDGPSADVAARLLALSGDEHDAAALLARTQRTPTAGLVGAVGWSGAAASIPPLIQLLESEAEGVPNAAAWALDRITGARLWDEVELPADEIAVADPPEPNVGEPGAPRLARMASDPRDLPPPPKPEMLEQPTTDPARWRAYWLEHGARYDPNGRYRRGQPYSPLVSLGELDHGRCTPGERRLLQLELVIRTGAFVRFDPHDFVPVQEEALRAWHPIASRTSSTPGRWTRPYRRTA